MEKILDFVETTPIVAYQNHAYYHGILFTHSEYVNQFMSNYINIYYHKNANCKVNFVLETWYPDADFFLANKIFYKKSLDLINNNEMLEIIFRMLDMGYYMLSHFDEYYVPRRHATGKFHNRHDFLTLGYTSHVQNFHIIGYTDNGVYEKSQISFNDFCLALRSEVVGDNWIDFVKIDPSFVFELDTKRIRSLIGDYIHSRNSYGQYVDQPCTYGINATIDFMKDFEANAELLDLRFLRVLYEQKSCMLQRLHYLRVKGHLPSSELVERFEPIVHLYESALMLATKTVIKSSRANCNKIREMILKSVDKELDILNDIYILL